MTREREMSGQEAEWLSDVEACWRAYYGQGFDTLHGEPLDVLSRAWAMGDVEAQDAAQAAYAAYTAQTVS